MVDFSASGTLRIGVVVISVRQANRRSASSVKRFEQHPLAYRFADAGHPRGNPKRTYATDVPLNNPEEKKGHVSGTFPYDSVRMTIPYDLKAGQRGAVTIAPGDRHDPQYSPAVDTGKFDVGNYGVVYDITVNVRGEKGERAQLLLDPRGAGRHVDPQTGNTYVNAYSGVVDVPANTQGSFLSTPAEDKVKCKDEGIGIGVAKASSPFSVGLIPPGGATLPLALLLTPAFVKEEASVSHNGVTFKAKPRIVPIVAGATIPNGDVC